MKDSRWTPFDTWLWGALIFVCGMTAGLQLRILEWPLVYEADSRMSRRVSEHRMNLVLRCVALQKRVCELEEKHPWD